MKPITVLSIYTAHNATCAFLKDGKLVSAVSEERFNRKKNWIGFPIQSIEWTLKNYNLRPEDIDAVAVCGKIVTAGIASEALERKTPLLSKIYGNVEYRSGPFYGPIFGAKDLLIDKPHNFGQKGRLIKLICDHVGVPKNKIIFVDHHTCHAYSAYFGQTNEREKALVLTLDGEGDNSCATVNKAWGYNVKRTSSTWRHYSIGYIYSLTTKFMGMTPLEHEYKVMGLAPYASTKEKKYFMKTYDKAFKGVIDLDKENPLNFRSRFPTNRFELYLRQKAVGERFDNLAGALQYMTEDVVSRWVKKVVQKTKNPNLYCGGGVFMNVKMNMLIAELPEVKKLNILPSCGDESNPIGAAYYTYIQLCRERGIRPKTERITDLYLGPDYDDEVEDYIRKRRLERKYRVRKADAKTIAQMIAKGEIVARSVGRMEWGARSLGNRCIMANPSDLRYVWQINEQIKMRDFWMPFAPTILKERERDYIKNPKKIEAPYMIMAFRSTDLAKKELRAAMHQADFTLRPQMLERSWNPKYYDIIKEFENITGIGGILNTSFNLHGKPIVASPKDAVEETFEQSGLNHLLLGDYLISKK